MASTMSTCAVTVGRLATPAKSGNRVAPSMGLTQTRGSNKLRVNCMQVWPIEGIKKFETLSYLPDLSEEDLVKQIEYLIRSKWIPSLEFSKVGFVFREHHHSPGYYDGRYWTMWKLPMFGCTDPAQVLKEVFGCKKEYPEAFVRIIGFDNTRQVQCVSFIASKPN